MSVQLLIIFMVLLKSGLTQPAEVNPNEILANYNSSVLPGPDVCGLPRIIVQIITNDNDSETLHGEFPWMAGLEYNQNGGIRCGGSLINNRYVLTAAHCLNETEYKLISVWLGMWKMSTVENEDKDKVKKLDIEEKIRHELFQAEYHEYDIALIRLKQDVTYTHFIIPICLPKQGLPVPSLGTSLTVAGWGYVTESGPRSNILLKVEVPVVQNNKCAEIFNLPITDHQLCVGGKHGSDSCNGDSGGPLMLSFEGQWHQQGIVSFGYGCGRAEKPAVYARVSKYIDWIWNKLK